MSALVSSHQNTGNKEKMSHQEDQRDVSWLFNISFRFTVVCSKVFFGSTKPHVFRKLGSPASLCWLWLCLYVGDFPHQIGAVCYWGWLWRFGARKTWSRPSHHVFVRANKQGWAGLSVREVVVRGRDPLPLSEELVWPLTFTILTGWVLLFMFGMQTVWGSTVMPSCLKKCKAEHIKSCFWYDSISTHLFVCVTCSDPTGHLVCRPPHPPLK